MFDATTAQRLTTDGDWFEPYFISLGYRLGNVLVLSGQASISEQGEIVGAGDFDAQAAQTFANIERVLGLATNWMIHSTALLERSWLEFERRKTMDRAMLQIQALIDQQMMTAGCVL